MRHDFRRLFLPLLSLALVFACGSPSPSAVALRLVDRFASGDVSVKGSPLSPPGPGPVQWSFEDAPDGDTLGWKAGPGVSELTVRGGRLAGRTTTEHPVLHVERAIDPSPRDVLHEIVVRMRVSRGANLSVSFSGAEELDVDALLGRARITGWTITSPIVAGEETTTYRISPSLAAFTPSFASSATRHVVLRPSDAAGAEFEVESVRLVFRTEHLASIPAGVSWQGLSDVFRETLVTRSPERAEFPLVLPGHPLLDLALGTVEDGATTFSVGVRPEGGEETVVLRRTLTTPDRWEEVSVDLEGFAGRTVTLSLSAEAERPGVVAFWGAPSVRSRGALPEPEADSATLAAPLGLEGDAWRPPRGVVLVLLDTLRRDHLDAYGYERPTAPALARMAREGVVFRDAISQAAWTKASVPSMLTSTYPTSNGIVNFDDRVPASADTLAEAMREAGYATWGSSSVPFSGRLSNLHQGVEVLHERASIDLPEAQAGSKTARALVDRLLPWIERHRDVPFFAVLHAMDPHSDYEPYAPYDAWWADPEGKARHEEWTKKVTPLIRSDFMKRMGLPMREELLEAGIDPEAFVAHELHWYDGSIRGADAEVGRLFEKLRELGIDEETLVVVTSDHGEEFLDHGGHFHEENVYGELVNVPLLVRWPGTVPAGVVVEETVQLLDVAPTLIALTGREIPGRMQGQSLVPLLSPTGERRGFRLHPAISEWTKRRDQEGTRIVDATSIIFDGWKLIHNHDRPEDVPEYELYDHAADPLDQNDLAEKHPEMVERLAAQLEEWRKWAEANRLPTDAQSTDGMSSEELERLRSLGYVR